MLRFTEDLLGGMVTYMFLARLMPQVSLPSSFPISILLPQTDSAFILDGSTGFPIILESLLLFAVNYDECDNKLYYASYDIDSVGPSLLLDATLLVPFLTPQFNNSVPSWYHPIFILIFSPPFHQVMFACPTLVLKHLLVEQLPSLFLKIMKQFILCVVIGRAALKHPVGCQQTCGMKP